MKQIARRIMTSLPIATALEVEAMHERECFPSQNATMLHLIRQALDAKDQRANDEIARLWIFGAPADDGGSAA